MWSDSEKANSLLVRNLSVFLFKFVTDNALVYIFIVIFALWYLMCRVPNFFHTRSVWVENKGEF